MRTRKVGGIRFFWIGRLVFSVCIKRKPNTTVAKPNKRKD